MVGRPESVVQRRMTVAGRLRAAGRLIAFVVGSWLVVARAYRAVFSGFPARWRRNGPHNARWARLGARCLGIRVRRVGAPPPPGSLVVANHYGYADVLAIGGLFPVVYAARHDMRRWPMFGALAASGATIFINRENVRAGARGVAQVAQALAAGATVLGFPEGTSAGAGALLPFHSGLFQAALDAGARGKATAPPRAPAPPPARIRSRTRPDARPPSPARPRPWFLVAHPGRGPAARPGWWGAPLRDKFHA